MFVTNCEEAYEIDEEDFNRIDESLRGKLPDGYFIQWTLTFNPWTECWLKSRFFDTQSDKVFSLTTTYLCNEWLSKADYDMFEEIKKYDPERYKVVGLGQWGLVGGAFFDCWRENLHVVKPFTIPEGWIKFRAADWGSFHPYAVLWFAIDYDGNLWCYRELYGWGGKPNAGTRETAKQLGERIAAIEKESKERIQYAVLDNACWASPGTTGPSIAEEINGVLTANNLISFGKSSKGRAEGANQIRQRLIGTVINGEQKPALRFFNTCIHTIRTLPSLTFDKYNPETYDTQGEDHCTDSVAYACLSRPYAPQIIKPKQIDAYSTEREHASVWTI